ncbi:MAG: radical SAM/SPASM domain-containing protein [bacterium]
MNFHTVPTFPKRIEIELVSACNLRCTYCPRHYVDMLKGYIDYTLFEKIIDEIAHYPDSIIVLHRRGESMLHPKFNDMLNLVAGKFAEVQMATNATLLHRDKYEALVTGLTFLSFSIDTPERFNKTRIPADYQKVEKNILDFLEYNNSRIKTQVSMVKTPATSDEECDTFREIWKGRVDRIRLYEEHSKEGKFGSLDNPRSDRKACVMPFYEMLIYDSGVVARCNHDWNSEDDVQSMGNVTEDTIHDIWHNERYDILRNEHVSLHFNDPVCKECDSWYPAIGTQGTGEIIEND